MTAHEKIEGQSSVFDVQPNWPVAYGQSGSYVDVEFRARMLIETLDSFSAANSREGLQLGAFTQPHSAEIWVEFQENTEVVLTGAERNRQTITNLGKRAFWLATGFPGLKGKGLMRERQINPRARKMWRDFTEAYEHPKKLKDRRKYKKKLQKFLD